MDNYAVFLTPFALQKLKSVVKFIADEIKMPETGKKYGKKMRAFVNDIGKNPYTWPFCHGKDLAAKGLRCAVLDKKWVFAYEISDRRVIVKDIIYGSLIKE